MTPEQQKGLLLAILAMDSYNQGYDKGLFHGETQIGTATYLLGSEIVKDENGNRLDIAAGFYASAYTLADGTVVISYRGTDNPILLSTETAVSDITRGWISALGVPTSQTGLALQFYNAVTQSTYEAGPAANTILTGHSLGGGLAGFVAALSGTQAQLF
jgi:Protein of unknown function (DUF2974)